MKKLFMSWFSRKAKFPQQIDSKQVRRWMYDYFLLREWGYETQITKVDVFKNEDNSLTVVVESYRPGMIIGRAGEFINGLEKHLSENLKTVVKVEPTECKMWMKLWNTNNDW